MTGCRPGSSGANTSARSTRPSSIVIGTSHSTTMARTIAAPACPQRRQVQTFVIGYGRAGTARARAAAEREPHGDGERRRRRGHGEVGGGDAGLPRRGGGYGGACRDRAEKEDPASDA